MKTPEEDAESSVRHRNRAGLTSDERKDTIHSEKSFKEVGKALCEEQTVNNPTERNARLRLRGLGRQATSTRQSSGEQSTGQATASSARLQLTEKSIGDELVSALIGEAYVEDALPKNETLAEHDKKKHPDGFDPETDTCKFRERIAAETEADNADIESPDAAPKGDETSKVVPNNLQTPNEKSHLESVAAKVKNFIKGVKVRIADKPYDGNAEDERRSIKARDNENWHRAIVKALSGDDAHFEILSSTPAVLRRLGAPNLPIVIPGRIIREMLGHDTSKGNQFHQLRYTDAKNLLIELDNPIAVLESTHDDSLVILTRLISTEKQTNREGGWDVSRENAIIALKIDSKKHQGGKGENIITSVYGKAKEAYKTWFEKKGIHLLYLNREAHKAHAQWLQLPKEKALRANLLTEKDFSGEELGHIIPDSSAAVKGVEEKKVTTNPVISFRNPKGEVVGTYNRETNEIVVYPGADADTIGHELCGHATWQFAEQQAKKGNDTLLKKMQEVVDSPTAKPVWEEVQANYDGESHDVQREEVWAHIIGHETSKAIEEIQKSRRGRKWYQKVWNVVKDAWKGLLSTVRINSVHLEGTEEMSPKEFSEYIVKQMLEGKKLGTIEKDRSGGEWKSIRSKSIVSPEEDAAYMAAVEKGDMETAAKMVHKVAARAMPNTKVVDADGLPKVVYHATPERFTRFDKDKIFSTNSATFMEGFYFSDRKPKTPWNVMPVFLNATNPLVLDLDKAKFDTVGAQEIGDTLVRTGAYNPDLNDYLIENGIVEPDEKGDYEDSIREWYVSLGTPDSMIVQNTQYDSHKDEYVVLDPAQIKSADPVTYDDNGNVIPLSRRFDDGDDIRGDVYGKTEYIEKMKSLHPNIDPEELINRLKNLGSREEMETEIKKILGKK